MNTRSKSVRAAVVLTAAGALLLSGCGEQQADTQAVSHSGPATASAAPKAPTQSAKSAGGTATAAAPLPAPEPKPEPEPESPIPVEHPPTELPPGDPGLDAPPAPDPGQPEHDREHEEPARTVVPTEAMLDTQTVSAVLGGQWQEASAQPLECLTGSDAVAERSAAYGSADGQVLQTVGTHRSLAAADRAVADAGRRLSACGWTALPDPRLGTASAAATSADETQSAVVVSAEGVTVTLIGSASATSNRARWSSLVDLALGTSCAAAPHGCH